LKPLQRPVRTFLSLVLTHPWAFGRVLGASVGPARGHRADQDLGAGVGGSDRRVGRAHQLAVQVRRDGVADLAEAGVLRAQPGAEVGLVPDHVAVDAVPVARRDRAREVGEQRRVRVPARVAALGAAAGPQGPGAGDRQQRLDAGADNAVHGVVELVPLVRRGRARAADPRPQRVDPHLLDAELLPLGDGCIGLRAAGEQHPVVGEAELRAGGLRGRGEDEHEQEGEQRARHAD
jgi:hypothetical protein